MPLDVGEEEEEAAADERPLSSPIAPAILVHGRENLWRHNTMKNERRRRQRSETDETRNATRANNKGGDDELLL